MNPNHYHYAVDKPWEPGSSQPVLAGIRNGKRTRELWMSPDRVKVVQYPKVISVVLTDSHDGSEATLNLNRMEAERLMRTLMFALKNSKPALGHDTWLDVEGSQP